MADLGFKSQRIADLQAGHVNDVLAVVGDQGLAVFLAHHSLAAHRRKLPHDTRRGHGNHFHRQRKVAQHLDQFGLVGNADKPVGLRSHDFFARERRATALDHIAVAVNLVGAVNVDRQTLDLIGVKHRDTQRQQAFGAGHRARHRALDLVFDRGQGIDEFIDGGAGAHAHQFAAHHVLQRGLADQGFELVLRQCAGFRGGRWAWGAGRCVHQGKSP